MHRSLLEAEGGKGRAILPFLCFKALQRRRTAFPGSSKQEGNRLPVLSACFVHFVIADKR